MQLTGIVMYTTKTTVSAMVVVVYTSPHYMKGLAQVETLLGMFAMRKCVDSQPINHRDVV